MAVQPPEDDLTEDDDDDCHGHLVEDLMSKEGRSVVEGESQAGSARERRLPTVMHPAGREKKKPRPSESVVGALCVSQGAIVLLT